MMKLMWVNLLFLIQFAYGQKATTTFDDVLHYYQNEKNFNGTLLVATNGKIDYLGAGGTSNRASGTSINTKSKFKIASITKTFTAVLIMQLVEQQQVNLKATIGKYLPGYTGEAKNKVTIENLLTYSSGLPNCESYIGENIYSMPVGSDSFIIKYCNGNLLSKPGTSFSYNNGDYILLGKIIEAVTGKTFEENLNEKILRPLEMVNTSMLGSTDIVTGLVPSYTYDDSLKRFKSDKPYYIENYFSSGAMYSTAEDLLKFDQGIFTHKILKKNSVDLMLTPYPSLGNVGLGFWVSAKYGLLNTPFAYRPGGIYGSAANWIHVIDSNRVIIALSNTDAGNLFEMSQQLNAVATGQPINIPARSKKESTTALNILKAGGKWLIDLRPSPKSEPYIKDFILTPGEGNSFSGEFYGTAFANGQFNTQWEYLYFAFSTRDKDNVYFHSGYIDGDKISGISYSSERKFIAHWSGTKK